MSQKSYEQPQDWAVPPPQLQAVWEPGHWLARPSFSHKQLLASLFCLLLGFFPNTRDRPERPKRHHKSHTWGSLVPLPSSLPSAPLCWLPRRRGRDGEKHGYLVCLWCTDLCYKLFWVFFLNNVDKISLECFFLLRRPLPWTQRGAPPPSQTEIRKSQ